MSKLKHMFYAYYPSIYADHVFQKDGSGTYHTDLEAHKLTDGDILYCITVERAPLLRKKKEKKK